MKSKIMKKTIKEIAAGIVIALVIILAFKTCKIKSLKNEIRKSVIVHDTLRLVDSNYYKLVNDMKTQRQLNRQLKAKNRKLYKRLRKAKSKVITVTDVKTVFKTKVDTIYNTDTVYVSNDYFYPNKGNWFVKHSITPLGRSSLSTWKFGVLPISIILTQTKDGLFENVINAPDFVKITELTVNSLPLKKIKERNIRYLLGVGVKKRYLGNYNAKVNVGIRFKKNVLIGSIYSDISYGFDFLREF